MEQLAPTCTVESMPTDGIGQKTPLSPEYGTWHGKVPVHRGKPSVPVMCVFRTMRQASAHHAVVLGRKRGMVDICARLVMVRHHWCEARADIVHKEDEHRKRSRDRILRLRMDCLPTGEKSVINTKTP